MLRTLFGGIGILCLVLLTGNAVNGQKDNAKDTSKGEKATITKIDAKNHTVTVKMKGKDNKEVEKTFKLAEDIRYFDSTGHVAAVDVFRSGDLILVVEEQGRLRELRQAQRAQQAGGAQQLGDTDRRFVHEADEIDLTEVKLGKVVQDHAASPAIKKFAERFATDHGKMNKELRKIAANLGVTLPEKLDQKHQNLVNSLSKTNGADFDRVFAKDMVSGHEKAIEKFEDASKNCQNAELKDFASRWLPTLREHLRLARDAAKDVK